MNKKNNRQFQNSDVRMKHAMLELMNTTPFDKITVRLICEKAKVNRSTFYAHYTDIYDMLGQMVTNLHIKLLEYYTTVCPNVSPLSFESITTFLEFIQKHKEFYRVTLKARWEFPLKRGFEPLWEQVVRPLCLKAGITSENDMIFYFVAFQAGFTMILKRWAEQDFAESNEKIAQIIQNIIPSIWKIE